jgi:hypothetical protein
MEGGQRHRNHTIQRAHYVVIGAEEIIGTG